MDFQEIKEKVTEKAKSIYSKLYDFVINNKIKALIIALLVCLVLLLLVLVISLSSAKKAAKAGKLPEEVLILSEKPVIPPSPSIPKDYNISRKTKSEWTEEQSEEWFTYPDEDEIDSLSNTNENMVNELLGAAP